MALPLAILMVSFVATMPPSAGRATAADTPAEHARARDPRDPGRLDVRMVKVTETVDALSVRIRMRRAWPPRLVGRKLPNRLFVIFDVDGDGRRDYRARVLKNGRWPTTVLHKIGGEGLPNERLNDHGIMLFRPNRRTITLRIPQGSVLTDQQQTGVFVRTTYRSDDASCRPCRDRAPNTGRLQVSRALIYKLEPIGSSSVPLGAPFRFRLTVTNATDAAASIGFPLSVGRADHASPIRFADHALTVPAGSTASLEDEVVTGQWFKETGTFEVRSSELPVAPLSFEVSAPITQPALFTDATEATGLVTHHATETICGGYAAGAAWGDADGDGRVDLYLPRQTAPALLWLQQPGGTFNEAAAAAGVQNLGSKGMGAVFGDYDNDGDQDLYVVNDGADRLYQNGGAGTFTDVTIAAGVGDTGPGSSASWGDYDADGDLDLYVTNYFRCVAGKVQRFDDVLYRNNGDGTFTDATHLLQAEGPTDGLAFQAAWTDYDGDGDVDLYLANDYIGHLPAPNILWRNDGAGGPLGWRFTNVSLLSGTGAAMNAMGIGIGDYDGDLQLDMAVSNMGAAKLFTNEGSGSFSDRAEEAGVGRETQGDGKMTVTWGAAFADLNNDAWEDLYIAGGSLSKANTDPQPNAVYVNAGDGTFFDLSAMSGADDPRISRGVALADYDRDGRVDVYVVNQWGAPKLYRNVTPPSGHWLEVDLEGVVSNRDACGASVIAHLAGGRSLLREVHCGSVGLASGSDTVLHFGLGTADHAESLEIRWPSGIEQTVHHADTALQGFVEILEAGSGAVRPLRRPGAMR